VRWWWWWWRSEWVSESEWNDIVWIEFCYLEIERWGFWVLEVKLKPTTAKKQRIYTLIKSFVFLNIPILSDFDFDFDLIKLGLCRWPKKKVRAMHVWWWLRYRLTLKSQRRKFLEI
jgi:hypothetical protein